MRISSVDGGVAAPDARYALHGGRSPERRNETELDGTPPARCGGENPGAPHDGVRVGEPREVGARVEARIKRPGERIEDSATRAPLSALSREFARTSILHNREIFKTCDIDFEGLHSIQV